MVLKCTVHCFLYVGTVRIVLMDSLKIKENLKMEASNLQGLFEQF